MRIASCISDCMIRARAVTPSWLRLIVYLTMKHCITSSVCDDAYEWEASLEKPIEVYFIAESKLNKRQNLNQILFSRIHSDLAPWQEKGISLEQVERTYCTLFEGGYVDGGFRVQVRNSILRKLMLQIVKWGQCIRLRGRRYQYQDSWAQLKYKIYGR